MERSALRILSVESTPSERTESHNGVSRERAIHPFAHVSIGAIPSHDDDLFDVLVCTDVLGAVEAPWSMREEKQLRAAWVCDFPSRTVKARHLIAEVERIEVEPHHAPEPLPPIEGDDIHLVCWMAIENSAASAAVP
ncbi:MAG: hypothetical protein ACKVXR_13580 [Planctomycetota bacterium]